MKLNVFCYKNKQLKAFTNPIFDDHDAEVTAISTSRYLMSCNLADAKKMKHLVLYKIGEFDDETGIFTSVGPELLLDTDDIIGEREVKADEEI